MITIYLVTQTYFNNRDKKRFGLNYFLNKNYKVIVIDVQEYINPELNYLQKPLYENHNNLEVVYCNNFKKIKTSVKTMNNSIAILFLPENFKAIKIKKYLQGNNIKIGIWHGGMIPSVSLDKTLYTKIVHKVSQLNIESSIFFLFNKIYVKLFNISNYDFLITSNYKVSQRNYNIPKPLNIIETHCFDYDLIIENRKYKNNIDQQYIVFLDQNLIDHTDFITAKDNINISSQKYFNELNDYFLILEEKTGCSVIISAHPRADIKNYKILFKGRKIVCGETESLVKHCKFVITNHSTAINFAVIFNKPIIFFTNNDLKKHDFNNLAVKLSILLNQKYINISDAIDVKDVKDVKSNINSYKNYKENFIKKNNIELFSYEIFDNEYIKKMI